MEKLTREAVIEAVKAAASSSGSAMSRSDLVRITGISDWAISRLFPDGRWSEVRRLAGIDLHDRHHVRSAITREAVIAAARKAAAKVEGALRRSDFVRLSGISGHVMLRLFPDGGWAEVLRQADLDRHPSHLVAVPEAELLSEFDRVVTQVGGIPTWAALDARARVSAETLRKRFGGLRATVDRYRKWLKETRPESPNLRHFGERASTQLAVPMPSQAEAEIRDSSRSETLPRRGRRPEYGEPIDFRGLRHAPINELGVVFLFGMLSQELGFNVEAVHAAYPDCVAKRCTDARRRRWREVRVEFEFESRNFRDHGHDADFCDLVVCWRHNWPECPLEVIELKSVIATIGR